MTSRRRFILNSAGFGCYLFSKPNAFALNGAENTLFDNLDCGVASGDPKPESVTIWTRIPSYCRLDLSSCEVMFEVSRTPQFNRKDIVATGYQQTDQRCDFTCHIRIANLAPDTYYYYRFSFGSRYQSVVGRTKTAPAPSSSREIRFAFMCCQDYVLGYYNAYAALMLEHLDFCIHLGDFIYESAMRSNKFFPVRYDPILNAVTLNEYRQKYRLYLSDPFLREARRLFPFIHIGDDHDVFNNYSGKNLEQANRIAAGRQVFAEYLPIELEENPAELDGIKTPASYRSFEFGKMVGLTALDLRTYRDEPKKKGKSSGDQVTPSILGIEQKQFLKNQLSSATKTWNFLLSSVMFVPLKFFSSKALLKVAREAFSGLRSNSTNHYINPDSWDGYEDERQEIIDVIASVNVKNFVVLSGDVHTTFRSKIFSNPNDIHSKFLGYEITTHAISSRSLSDIMLGLNINSIGVDTLMLKMNPHIYHANLKSHGYTVIEAGTSGLRALSVACDTVKSLYSPVSVAHIDTIANPYL